MESRDYWLGHCEGFRVDSSAGRVGLVEEVVFGGHRDRPDALVVRAGVLGRRLVLVPVEEVEGIRPRKERVLLRSSWRPSGSDFLTDLLHRLRDAARGPLGPDVDAARGRLAAGRGRR